MSTRVIVTGGAGFIGTLLARRLLAESVTIGGGGPAPVDELVLADLRMHGNIDGMRAILEHARRHRTPPVLVFSSSLAVFGQDPALLASTGDPVGTVGDGTLPRPQTSYGIYKLRH